MPQIGPSIGSGAPSISAIIRIIENGVENAKKILSNPVLKITDIEDIAAKLKYWKNEIASIGAIDIHAEWSNNLISQVSELTLHVKDLEKDIVLHDAKNTKMEKDGKIKESSEIKKKQEVKKHTGERSICRKNKWTELPRVNIVAAVSLLSLKDLMVASQVCKHWHIDLRHAVLNDYIPILRLYGKGGLLLRLGMYPSKLRLGEVNDAIKETLASSWWGSRLWKESLVVETLPNKIKEQIEKRKK